MKPLQNFRLQLEEQEEQILAPYAMKSKSSKGRVYPEEEHPYRTHFQRDRDRIIHSTAFRRLEYKTQVFVNHEGDHYRTRLTHTIEVAQISRSIARTLRLNEDLAEAIALVHDLGHTPFGHSGEEVLNEIMKDHGGFEHNLQSLRVVDILEEKYPTFPGLNLCYEVREGIIKHESIYNRPIPARFYPKKRATLEAQMVDLADEIAYNAHDIDDGLYSGVLTEEMLSEVELWKKLSSDCRKKYPNISASQRRTQIVRMLINWEVTDLIEATTAKIRKFGIKSLEDVRKAPENILTFSDSMKKLNAKLKFCLLNNMYHHYRVIRMSDKAKRIMRALFETYAKNPEQLPPSTKDKLKHTGRMQVVCDYIAGMTDRFALQEYKKLFDPLERV